MKYKKYSENNDVVSAFLVALEVELRQLGRKQKTFSVLMFLNVDRSDILNLEPISILGDRIVLKQWDELDPLKVDDLWQQVWSRDRTNPIFWQTGQNEPVPHIGTFRPVLLEVETYGPEAALAIASDRLDILRSILNMSAILGVFTYFRAEPKSLSSILPTPIYGIFDSFGNLVSTYITIEKYDYQIARIRGKHEKYLSNAKYLLSIFDHELKHPDTHHHILRLIRLYQGALDIVSPWPAYLAMWQVLESAVTLRGERVANETLRKRISSLTQLDPLSQDALNLLDGIRNELVHAGVFLEESDDAFFTLKLIADKCIVELLNRATDFSTVNDLREYFTYATCCNAVLDRKKQVISTIQKHRDNA